MSGALWTAAEAARATGGTTGGTWQAGSVTIDSRNVATGALFVALPGERFDGHDFVAEALAKGAAAAIVSRVPAGLEGDGRLLLVKDSYRALEALASAARARSHAKIAAVTGSVGKTGTKEMLLAALSASGKTHASLGNLNNHIGVPLSLANLARDADYAVFELGMNHAGEISALTRQVRPHVALITTIEAVHLEFFGSAEGIARAKAEIFEGVEPGGSAILPADNAHYALLAQEATAHGVTHIVPFGESEAAASRLLDYQFHAHGSEATAVIGGTKLHFHLGAMGKHWAVGAVAALSAAEALGADLASGAAALQHFREPKGRGRVSLVAINGLEVTLVDDSYNASPASMKGAIAKVSEMKRLAIGPRVVAVLGDMLELGPQSTALHMELIPSLMHSGVDLVFSAGTFMKHLYDALPEQLRGEYAETAQALAPRVMARLQHRDIVLVKGSHGSQIHQVVKAIEDAADKR